MLPAFITRQARSKALSFRRAPCPATPTTLNFRRSLIPTHRWRSCTTPYRTCARSDAQRGARSTPEIMRAMNSTHRLATLLERSTGPSKQANTTDTLPGVLRANNGDEQTTKQNETKWDEWDTQELDEGCVGVRGCFYKASSQPGRDATNMMKAIRKTREERRI
ncbi:hypothetical protein HYPSUDRAFT_38885 [Hypholoma sublateritium FD-334 SS-4]|uniref:Uncharacterized protein n=1 Tax=Hypholoma sublateritium (strain FD-334 SS-4) TaxID=945553 RepID=A0A0D2LB14_HYPSF|nr:hypothetical protein HYPSUDRAFT_38885 [Hypholoma sublateritium FD-334 SS-4]